MRSNLALAASQPEPTKSEPKRQYKAEPGHPGLYRQTTRKKRGGFTQSWIYRYVSPVTGKTVWMGLGSCAHVAVDDARELAREGPAGHIPTVC